MKLTNLLLAIFILSLPLGQLGRLPFGGEEVNFYIYDILVPAILFAWFLCAFGIRKKVAIPPLSGLILAFAFISLISLINTLKWLNTEEFFVSGSYWIRWVMYAGLYFAVYDLSLSDLRNKDFIVNLLIVSGVILAILGFLQLIFVPDFKQLAETGGWDPHKNRLASTFLDPNFCGAYLVLTANLIISKILPNCCHPELVSGSQSSKMPKKVRHDAGFIFYLLACGIIATALLLTFSRSAWLMFAVSVFVIGILKSKKLLIAACVIAFCAYYFVPRVQTRLANITDPADSASKRLASWQGTWDIAKENPIAGVGFNAFRYAQKEAGYFEAGESGGRSGAGSDSSLLLVLATTGVIGLATYLTLHGKIALDALYNVRASPISLALLASLAGLFLESNFINSLFYPQIMAWVWIMTALLQKRNEYTL